VQSADADEKQIKTLGAKLRDERLPLFLYYIHPTLETISTHFFAREKIKEDYLLKMRFRGARSSK